MAADAENILAAFAHAVDTHDLDLAVRLLESTSLIPHPDRLFADPSRRAGPGRDRVWSTTPATRSCSWPPRSPPKHGERRRLAQEYGDAALDAEQAVTAPRPYAVDLSAIR